MVTRQRQLHDGCGGDPSLDFVNSVDRTAGEPTREELHAYADLTLWSSQAGTLPARRAADLARLAADHPRRAAAVLARAVALREAIYRAFDADIHGRRPARSDLATINTELASALAHLRVGLRADRFHWRWSKELLLDAPLWPIARAAAELLVSPNRELVKQCASDSCQWLFLDVSRNHGRRWCEMKTCGNRAKVREHRRRQRTDA